MSLLNDQYSFRVQRLGTGQCDGSDQSQIWVYDEDENSIANPVKTAEFPVLSEESWRLVHPDDYEMPSRPTNDSVYSTNLEWRRVSQWTMYEA